MAACRETVLEKWIMPKKHMVQARMIETRNKAVKLGLFLRSCGCRSSMVILPSPQR